MASSSARTIVPSDRSGGGGASTSTVSSASCTAGVAGAPHAPIQSNDAPRIDRTSAFAAQPLDRVQDVGSDVVDRARGIDVDHVVTGKMFLDVAIELREELLQLEVVVDLAA